jgi:subtilisin family serine protease
MKFFRFSLLSALLCSGATYAHAAPGKPEYAPGEILVRVKSSASAKVRQFAAASGGKTTRTYGSTGWQRIKLPANLSVEAALLNYKQLSGVITAEPNYKFKAFKAPNDKRFNELYAMAKINAPAAWDVNRGSKEVVVAVCDTGVKYNHPDLAANMWKNSAEIANNGKDDDHNGIIDDVYGYDALNGDGNPIDDNGHGTHCAGTIGAVGNNSEGVAGVNWTTKIMALKFLGADGSSFGSGVLDAYMYAINMKKRGVNLRVISNSWGGAGKSEAIRSIMQEAADNGIISICAAGNDSTDNDAYFTHPANEDVTGLVSVGASDEEDRPADFSNYGKKSVDLFAPGVNILSTWIGKGADAYRNLDGTSMACPHVAGAAALLLAQAPSMSVETLKARLLEAVDVVPQLRGKALTSGRLNLAKLLSNGIYSVRGIVRDDANNPLAGANIYINGSKTVSAVSGVDGTYSVDGLKPGTYKPTATLRRWKLTPTATQVTLGKAGSYVAKVDFSGKTTATVYSITGTVYVLSGTKKKPLKGVKLYLGDAKEAVAITDSTGKYTITGRAAGTYYVFAKLGGYDLVPVEGISLDGSAKVMLPAKNAATPTVDFVATEAGDQNPPSLIVQAPIPGASYQQDQLTRAYGTASDPSGVDFILYSLKRNTEDGTVFYLWDSKTWSNPVPNDDFFIDIPRAALLEQEFNSTNVSWSVDLPELEAGEYQFFTFPFDTLGNGYFFGFSEPFTVTLDAGEKVYPDVVITSPSKAKSVLANTVTKANGTASDENGIEAVYIYLSRYDENGQTLAYYNWAENTWVSPSDFDLDCYTTVEGHDQNKINWQVKLPKMVPGSYELGALGRDSYDNEPPLDGSQDTRSAFDVVNSVGASSSAASAKGPVSGASS